MAEKRFQNILGSMSANSKVLCFRNEDIIMTVEKNSEQTSPFHVAPLSLSYCATWRQLFFSAVELHSLNISVFAHSQ